MKNISTNRLKSKREKNNQIVDRDKVMTLGEHLDELRQRLIYAIIVIVAFMIVSLFFGPEIHEIFAKPYKNVLGQGATFYQIKLIAPFVIYLKTSFMISVLIGFPFIFFILWGFVSPAFDKEFDRYGKFIIVFSTLLFWGGVALCWYTVFENLLRVFLVDFRPADIEQKLPIDEYYDIFFNIHLIFGLTFQLPVLMVLLGRIGILKSSFVIKFWREAILILAFAAAFLSPGPDILSMLMLFIPLIFLFFISILIMKITERQDV